MCETLLNQDQYIRTFFDRHSSQAQIEYRTRLNATTDCIRFLLRQELAFRGHDESYDSSNQGNFLELLQFLANHNEDYNAVAFKNAPDNLKLTSPEIQKDIVSVASNEPKEQMAIILRYVNKNGLVVERFLGVEHVTSTIALSLKLALVALAKNHDDVNDLFNIMAIVVNIVGASSKRCDLLRDNKACKVIEALSNGELSSGKGLNQETNLQRASDTHWGSHYGTLMSIILMFSSIIDVLEIVAKDGSYSE
ncbi:zinc finger MYM-type protein 1-like [Pistacia vera]|uniref:zinc finger MYM-type protein 1-like n=1 Tax=Pistacia vera TaxID=55513 RepID=UPI001263E53C|nr:zinc finger MYM-type protein 1-like [Pistacia vera]